MLKQCINTINIGVDTILEEVNLGYNVDILYTLKIVIPFPAGLL